MLDTRKLSDGRLIIYAEENLSRIKANPLNGKSTELIVPTELAINAYSDILQGKSTSLAQRKGATLDENIQIDLFIDFVREHEGLIIETYGSDSSTYLEFYPQGMHEYTIMTKTTAGPTIKRMGKAYQLHSSELPPTRVSEMAKLCADFLTISEKQNVKDSATKTIQAEKNVLRRNLAKQIQYNILSIARINLGNPKMYAAYFEHSLITPYRSKKLGSHKGTIDAKYALVIKHTSVQQAEFTVMDGEVIYLHNTGQEWLGIYTAAKPMSGIPENMFMLEPGAIIKKPKAELGPAGRCYLFICNNSGTDGRIEIDIVS